MRTKDDIPICSICSEAIQPKEDCLEARLGVFDSAGEFFPDTTAEVDYYHADCLEDLGYN